MFRLLSLKSVIAASAVLAALYGTGVVRLDRMFDRARALRKQVDRQTAVARAERMIEDMTNRAAALTGQARNLRIEARTREKALERERERLRRKKEAVLLLAQAARSHGLRKPSQQQEKDLGKLVVFGGRQLSGREVYRLLRRWQADVTRLESEVALGEQMIERMRDTAEKLENKRVEWERRIHETAALVERLSAQRDLARINKEIAELGATVDGNPAGELEETVKLLQREIDEYEATAEVLADESPAVLDRAADRLTSETTDVAKFDVESALDRYWDEG